MSVKDKIVYCSWVKASFVKKDLSALEKEFRVMAFTVSSPSKWMVPFLIIKQFIFLSKNLPGAQGAVAMFGGYHALILGLMCRLFNIPFVLVLGGTDCVRFPSFSYGDHLRKVYGKVVERSIRLATHLVPVDKCLVDSEYTYHEHPDDPDRQGYRALFPDINTPYTVIPYGYDPNQFKSQGNKKHDHFLTVGMLSPSNVKRKGVDLILELARVKPNCRFTVLGYHPSVHLSDVPSNVELLRSVPYDSLPEFYSKHTYYLQLSMWEGFPSAPCEAMLCECVPIVSDVAALPEIVGDVGGILSKKDFNELVRTVDEVMMLDAAAEGKKARRRIMERFPIDTRMRLVRLLKEQIENQG